jgi:hypothetical protein
MSYIVLGVIHELMHSNFQMCLVSKFPISKFLDNTSTFICQEYNRVPLLLSRYVPTVVLPRRTFRTDAATSRTVVPPARLASWEEMPTVMINPRRAFQAHTSAPRTSDLVALGASRRYGMPCARGIPDGESWGGSWRRAVTALVFRIRIVLIISGSRIRRRDRARGGDGGVALRERPGS